MSSKGWRTMWEKGKLFVISNFSFFNSVFKRLLLQTRINKGLLGKGLRYMYCNVVSLPFPKRQILDSSKLKEFADDNFKFVENSGKSSKRIEITLGKGEMARDEPFLLFPKCFQRACAADMKKPKLVWERVKDLGLKL